MAATATASVAADVAPTTTSRDDGGDHPSSASSFATLEQCFSRRIDELQELLDLRVADSALPLFERDLRALDTAVGDLERTHAALRAQLAREREAAARLAKLLGEGGAAAAQAARAGAMSAGLPARLPSLPDTEALLRAVPRAPRLPPIARLPLSSSAGTTKASALARQARQEQEDGGEDNDADNDHDDDDNDDGPLLPPPARNPAAHARAPAPAPAAPPPPVAAPRWYVTQAELASAPAYLRGPRLTLERVNTAVDEAAALAEATSRLMAAVRGGGLARLVPNAEDRRRAAEMHRAATELGLRGRPWMLDADLRGAPPGAALRPDKSGRALLQLLRHLGRVQEHRLTLECAGGGACVAYVLLAQGAAAVTARGARR